MCLVELHVRLEVYFCLLGDLFVLGTYEWVFHEIVVIYKLWGKRMRPFFCCILFSWSLDKFLYAYLKWPRPIKLSYKHVSTNVEYSSEPKQRKKCACFQLFLCVEKSFFLLTNAIEKMLSFKDISKTTISFFNCQFSNNHHLIFNSLLLSLLDIYIVNVLLFM